MEIELIVMNNLTVTHEAIAAADALVISPGPGLPNQAGKLMSAIEFAVSNQKPILGICLGMQALAVFTGEELYNQDLVKHGVAEEITCDSSSVLFANCPPQFQVGLYHSWAVRLRHCDMWKNDAVSSSAVLMAIHHTTLPLFGVQFHPESILTENGLTILANFIAFVKSRFQSCY